MSEQRVQVVVARVVDDVQFVFKPGLCSNYRTVKVARAAMWARRGTAKDVQAARLHCEQEGEGWRAFVFPLGEPDPLGKAKALVLGQGAGEGPGSAGK